MEHAGFSRDDEGARRVIAAVVDHFFGGANFVGEHADGFGAFGMRDDGRAGEFFADAEDGGVSPFDVDVTVAAPKGHWAVGLFHHPGAEIFVGDEEEVFVFGSGIDDFDGVAAGDDNVGKRFHFGAAIDVGDGPEIWIGVLEGFEFWRRTTGFERTAGVAIGENYDFVWVKNFGGFGHEMNTTEDDDFSAGFGGHLGEAEGIADVIRDVLDFADLVIVREDDCVEFLFEIEDVFGKSVETGRGNALDSFEAVDPWRLDIRQINHALG